MTKVRVRCGSEEQSSAIVAGWLRFLLRDRQQWRELFKTYDVVLCPIMPTPAFPHDHSSDEESRKLFEDDQPVN